MTINTYDEVNTYNRLLQVDCTKVLFYNKCNGVLSSMESDIASMRRLICHYKGLSNAYMNLYKLAGSLTDDNTEEFRTIKDSIIRDRKQVRGTIIRRLIKEGNLNYVEVIEHVKKMKNKEHQQMLLSNIEYYTCDPDYLFNDTLRDEQIQAVLDSVEHPEYWCTIHTTHTHFS